MIIPDVGSNIQYKYTSPMINLNIMLGISAIEQECKLLTLEAPFIGKHFAIVRENEEDISVIKFGKGLFYGKLTQEDLSAPTLKLSKNKLFNEDIVIKDKYLIRMYPDYYTFIDEDTKFDNCRVLSFTHEKGYYYIYLKEGEGIIAVQNHINNVIKESIVKRKA